MSSRYTQPLCRADIKFNGFASSLEAAFNDAVADEINDHIYYEIRAMISKLSPARETFRDHFTQFWAFIVRLAKYSDASQTIVLKTLSDAFCLPVFDIPSICVPVYDRLKALYNFSQVVYSSGEWPTEPLPQEASSFLKAQYHLVIGEHRISLGRPVYEIDQCFSASHYFAPGVFKGYIDREVEGLRRAYDQRRPPMPPPPTLRSSSPASSIDEIKTEQLQVSRG